jgi:dephospho-CoA kinase
MIPRILSVGLTGGIACGKSVVTRELARLGAIILDADEMVHKLMEHGGAAFQPVVERFGENILDSRRRIDRAALGRRVFADPRERWALNGIVHPLVMQEEERLLREIQLLGEDQMVITDAALIVESGAHKRFDRLVVVYCSPKQQLLRLMQRDRLNREEALQRIESQMSAEKKIVLADYTVETGGSEEEAREKTGELYRRLRDDMVESGGGSSKGSASGG